MSDLIKPTDFKEKVTELVLNSFASLIPEDKLAALVDEQITAFFEEPVDLTFVQVAQGYSYNTTKLNSPMTPFRALVWTKVSSIIHKELESYFTRPEGKLQSLVHEMVAATNVEDNTLTLAQQLSLQMASTMMSSVAAQAARAAVNHVAVQAYNVQDPAMTALGNQLNNSGALCL